MHIFIPPHQPPALLLGFHNPNSIVVLKTIPATVKPNTHLSVVGYSSLNEDDSNYFLHIRNNEIIKPRNALLIFYNPPNLQNMEFFLLGTVKNHFKNDFLEHHLKMCSPKTSDLPLCISQINNVKINRRKSISQQVVRQIVIHDFPFNFLLRLRVLIENIILLLERLKLFNLSLLKVSCTAQQIHLRLNQLCNLPLEYLNFQKRKSVQQNSDAYIRFCNHLLLYSNDLCLGVMGYWFLRRNAIFVIDLMSFIFNKYMITLLVRASIWMTMFPAGFKLNPQLGQFIGDVSNWTVHSWQMFVDFFFFNKNISLLLTYFIGTVGLIGGFTLQLSLVVDLVSLMCFHSYLLYQSMSRVYSQQLNVLGSMFNLFRGLKYNKLRQRIDHGNYDMPQLFLGTILFTVSLFLLPTIFAFYMVFLFTRLIVFLLSALICMAITFLNHFPLFVVWLRIKSPLRLPFGVNFEIKDHALLMVSKPMGFQYIFKQYRDTVVKFLKKTFNSYTLILLLTGESLQFQQGELYASLYSALPERRATVEELQYVFREYCQQ